MENNQFDEKASLKLIAEMIGKTKSSLSESSVLLIMWGYLVLAATIMQYLMLYVFENYKYDYIGWPIFMGIGAIVSIVYVSRKAKSKKTPKTYIHRFMMYLWSGFLVTLLIAEYYVIPQQIRLLIPLVLILYGFALYVTGGMLKYWPLIASGVVCWLSSVVAFNVEYRYQLIVFAITVVVAYIIPGHLMYTKR